MAGIAKPNVEKLGKEAKYKVISIKASSGSGGTLEKCGLFDGTTPNTWNTPEVFYWNEGYDYYLEIEILSSNVNIWRSGTANFSSYSNPLTIYKWNGRDYVDVSNSYKQTISAIKNAEWEKTIYNLPKGRYKFTNNKKLRLDSEWYIEEIKNNKYLLKQNSNYYTLKSEFYKNGNYESITELEGKESLTQNDFETYGFDDLNLLIQNIVIKEETFKPKDKLKLINNGKFDIFVKEIE